MLSTEVLTAEDSFDRFAAWCATADTCALKGQDVGAVYDALVAGADRHPLPVRGALRPVTGEDIEAIIEGRRGPLIDGRMYHEPEFGEIAERYHRDALTAHRAHAKVELALPKSAVWWHPPEDEDEFLLADLVGLAVERPDGTPLGRVVGVPNYGGGDLLEIAPLGRGPTALLPFTKAFVPVVDLKGGRVVAEAPEDLFAPAKPEPDDPDAPTDTPRRRPRSDDSTAPTDTPRIKPRSEEPR